jgi:hypothetical protein
MGEAMARLGAGLLIAGGALMVSFGAGQNSVSPIPSPTATATAYATITATPKPAPTVTITARPVQASRSRTEDPVDAVRRCILARESHGDYQAVSKATYHGMHAYGGYQFQDPTWFHVTHLPGHASDYPEAVQDAAFLKLYANGAGRSNWYWKGHTQCW